MGATAGMVLTGADTAGQFIGQQSQARGIVSQAGFQSQIAALDARDAVARGTIDASLREAQGRRTIGAQRAGIAASGIDVNSGTAADLQADEAKFSELDAQTIRNNAAREAYGYTAQAGLNASAAQAEASNIRTQSYSTLLTGAAKTYGLYRDSRTAKLPAKPPIVALPAKAPTLPDPMRRGLKPGWK